MAFRRSFVFFPGGLVNFLWKNGRAGWLAGWLEHDFHIAFRGKSVGCLAGCLAGWLVEFCHEFVWLIISNLFLHGFPTKIVFFPRRLYGFSQFYVIIFLRFSKVRAGFGKCLRWVFTRLSDANLLTVCLAGCLAGAVLRCVCMAVPF